MNETALSIEDVCKVTGLGRTRIYQAIKEGKLIARKFGKRTLILRSDLDKFLTDLCPYWTEPLED